MTFLSFTVPGRPVPKGRPRFSHGHAFTPQRTREYERRIAAAAADAMGWRPPTELPVSVTVEAVYPPPRSPKQKAFDLVVNRAPYTGNVDLDNLTKAALDGINGLVFVDDRQVHQITANKRYGWDPCLTVTVEIADGN